MSLLIVTLSPNTFCPSFVEPGSAPLMKLRPSSACRALSEPSASDRNRAAGRGSRITVYVPGSTARGLRDDSALVDAVSLIATASIPETSLRPVVPAHPEPVPSGVRHVRIRLASAYR